MSMTVPGEEYPEERGSWTSVHKLTPVRRKKAFMKDTCGLILIYQLFDSTPSLQFPSKWMVKVTNLLFVGLLTNLG